MTYLALQTPLWLVAVIYGLRFLDALKQDDVERQRYCLRWHVGCLLIVNSLTLYALHR